MNNPEFRFQPDTHTYYLDGKRIPNITRIIRPMQDEQFFTEQARDRGSQVHKAIDNIVRGMEYELPDEYFGYIVAWKQFVKDHDYKSILSEQPMYHPAGWAGTPDQYGIVREGMLAVFELKTGASHPVHALQTAAQAELITANGYKRPGLRFTLQLKPTGQYSIKIHKGHSDLSVFNALLTAHKWAANNGIIIN